MRGIRLLVACCVLCAVLFGCGETKLKEGEVKVKSSLLPVFSGDSAYFFVKNQVAFGARVPNTKEHIACGLYLDSVLSTCTDKVVVQGFKARAYTGVMLNGKNYIASFSPEKTSRVLLMAHWDSRHIADKDSDESKRKQPILGANDGASGVGVLLEMARIMSDNPPPVGVDIVLFDLEDYGPTDGSEGSDVEWCLGSQYWSRNPHKLGYHANYGVLLDMVGDRESTFYIEGFSKYYAEGIVNKVWSIAHGLGYNNYFIKEEVGYITDDHLFVNKIAGIPTINIINTKRDSESSFAKYWHTTHDTMENIDEAALQAVGDVLINLIYKN